MRGGEGEGQETAQFAMGDEFCSRSKSGEEDTDEADGFSWNDVPDRRAELLTKRFMVYCSVVLSLSESCNQSIISMVSDEMREVQSNVSTG